jgi:hypothetical protein
VTDIKTELISLSEYVYTGRIRPRLEGITDDEYLWEPVAGCWSLRPDDDGRLRVDGARPLSTEHPPFTTLAWRLWHLIGCYGDRRNAVWLGVPPAEQSFETFDPAPASAADALDALDAAYEWWAATLAWLDNSQLEEQLGPVAGPYADASKAGFVLHQLDEVIHHGAETALVRDLYRAQVGAPTAAPATLIEAAAGGYWSDVRTRLHARDANDDVGATQPGDFARTALHYAAGSGPLDVVRMLVERGADTSVRDEQFDATPLGWAEYFGRDDVAAFLRGG